MSTDLRAEHDAVLTALSTRESTRHFAHAAVSVLFAIALAGTAAKLWWDFWPNHPEWVVSCIGLTLLFLGYAGARLLIGARANGKERVQLDRLRELRKALGVDAPASLTQQAS